MNRDYAGFLTQNITGFRNHTTGTDHVHVGENLSEGCTYQSAVNFNPYAIYEDGSCEWSGEPFPCAWTSELEYHMWSLSGNITNSYTEGSLSSDFPQVYTEGSQISPCSDGINFGCTDPEAQNYDPKAEQDWTHGDDYDTMCNYITDAPHNMALGGGKKGERVDFRRFGGNEYGFSSSGFQSNGFTEGAPTSQPIAASFSNACGCAG